ncbi:ATP-binding cassette domain-containing protein [Mucilaginibacter sp. AW1-3]
MIRIDIEKKMRAYEGYRLLKVQAEVTQGSITSVTGPSGSGKTTLLKIIAGLTDAEKGKITVDNQTWLDTDSKTSLSPQKRKCGFVFQGYALFPNMTVKQHLEYATTDVEWITDLLHFAKLETLTQHKPEFLSGGQQQRLAIIRALAIKPGVMLMDEPFSALDMDMKQEMIPQLKALLKKTNTTCLIVTHNPQELDEIATDSISIK